MKLVNAEIKNVRNHKATMMNFDQVNFVVGRNNAGKSTVKAALQMALTGGSEWSRHLKDMVKHGEKEAFVELEVDKLGIVGRIIKEKGTVVELNSHSLPDKELEKEFVEAFGYGYDVLSCVLNSSSFMNMKPAEQKDFLFKVSKAQITPQIAVSHMDNPSQEAKDLLLTKLPDPVTMEALDAAYDDFYASRKVAKKEFTNVESLLKAMAVPSSTPPIVQADIVEALKKAKEQHEGVIKQLAIISEQERQRDSWNQRLARLNGRISEIKSQIDPKRQVSDMEEMVFSLVTEINEARKKGGEAQATYKVLDTQTKSLKEILGKLNTDACPISPKLVCKTDKSWLTNDLQAQVDKNQQEMADTQALVKKQDDLEKHLVAQKGAVEKHMALKVELDSALEEKAQLEKDAPTLDASQKANLESEKDKWQNLIEGYQTKQKEYEAWERDTANYKSLVDQQAKLKESVALYEYLVKELSPKGLKSRILAKIIAPVEKHLNEKLAILTNKVYQVNFDFSNDFEVMVTSPNGTLFIDHLSDSEKLRISLVFQDTISSIANTRILCIDNVEILDQENKDLFIGFLKQVKDNYDTIMVIGTMEKDIAERTLKPQGKVFFVENGVVSEL